MSSTTSKIPLNTGVFATGAGQPLSIRPTRYTHPQAHELVIANSALAINPIDWLKLTPVGSISYNWIKYPFIFGYDNAGTVVELGSSVTRFALGDRVCGLAGGMDEKVNQSSHSSFQNFTVMAEHMTCRIPEGVSFEEAAVLPLGIATAACGLFQKDHLALEYPSSPKKRDNGMTVLIWGGSTSVGLNAIQLARAAGYTVYTTCSPSNFPLVQSAGASKAYDYASPNVIPDLVSALLPHPTAGAFSIGPGSADACRNVLRSLPSHPQSRKFLTMASFPLPATLPKHLPTLRIIFGFLTWNAAHWYQCYRGGVSSKFIMGSSLVENEVGPLIFGEFLGTALEEGTFKPLPEPVVVGKGLDFVETAFEVQKKGVSARKVVVSL